MAQLALEIDADNTAPPKVVGVSEPMSDLLLFDVPPIIKTQSKAVSDPLKTPMERRESNNGEVDIQDKKNGSGPSSIPMKESPDLQNSASRMDIEQVVNQQKDFDPTIQKAEFGDMLRSDLISNQSSYEQLKDMRPNEQSSATKSGSIDEDRTAGNRPKNNSLSPPRRLS